MMAVHRMAGGLGAAMDAGVQAPALELACAVAETLGLVGFPAAVLGPGGQALVANKLFEGLMPCVARVRSTRITLADGVADALFADAIARMGSAGVPEAVRSIPIRARLGRPPTIVHLIPVRGTALDVLCGASSIIVLTPVLPQGAPNGEVLQGLFDLTPAEARVARGIGEGFSVDAIAEKFELSRETVRTQLKAVLAKTGLGRQIDLAALLARVGLSSGPAGGAEPRPPQQATTFTAHSFSPVGVKNSL
jgi:DNA-binding CsgD family transcriptional regulator